MSHKSELTPDQEKQAKELAAARAHIIHEVVLREGFEEIERSLSSLAWSGLAAGMSVGISLMAEGLIADKLNSPQTSELVTKLGYPIGFIVPILGRQQLFTENTLTPIVPFLSEPNAANFKKVARLWGIVLVTNLIGAAIAGLICAVPQIFSTSTRLQFTQIAQSAIEGSFLSILLKGVIAGWFIALLTWLLGGVKHGEVALIFLLTYLVGIGGFPHIVVAGSIGSYLISQALMNLKECLINYFLPTLIGNIIGGIGLVAVLNHAQVVAGRHTQENPK